MIKNESNQSDKPKRQYGAVVLLVSAIIIGLCVLGILFFLSGCRTVETKVEDDYANHVFVFMGDGMGLNHVALTRYFEAEQADLSACDSLWKSDSFDSFPCIGLMTTHNMHLETTDSAASATAVFSGNKTSNESINVNPETDEVYTPLAKQLSEADVAVGVLSTTALEHASPAAMYAVQDSRYEYSDIARQGIFCGWLDFWAAGGFINSEDELEDDAKEAGFTVANNPDEFRGLDSSSLPVLGALADDAAKPYMAYEIDRSRAAFYGTDNVSFAEAVAKAIECFQQEDRFFIFAESGKVDTASAMLDAVTAIYEVKALDDAVAEALKFYKDNPDDTLIVVLSDHETGALWIDSPYKLDELKTQVASAVRFSEIMEELYSRDASFSDAMEMAEHYFGISSSDLDEDEYDRLERKYEDALSGEKEEGNLDPFVTELCEYKAELAKIGFVDASHSVQPVPVYAIGKGAENFTGLYDNTEIYGKLISVMGLDEP